MNTSPSLFHFCVFIFNKIIFKLLLLWHYFGFLQFSLFARYLKSFLKCKLHWVLDWGWKIWLFYLIHFTGTKSYVFSSQFYWLNTIYLLWLRFIEHFSLWFLTFVPFRLNCILAKPDLLNHSLFASKEETQA